MMEVKTISLEPNWKNMYLYFKQIEKEDEITFLRMVEKLGEDWHKLKAMAKKEGWDKDDDDKT